MFEIVESITLWLLAALFNVASIIHFWGTSSDMSMVSYGIGSLAWMLAIMAGRRRTTTVTVDVPRDPEPKVMPRPSHLPFIRLVGKGELN